MDDSANRRISLPEGFLCADAILRLAQNVTDGLHVNEKIIEKTVKEYLPFIATENLMMEAVKRGGDRQQIHEIIRRCSMEATAKMKVVTGICGNDTTKVHTNEEINAVTKALNEFNKTYRHPAYDRLVSLQLMHLMDNIYSVSLIYFNPWNFSPGEDL